MTSGIYNQAKYDLMTKSMDLVNDTIKCMLLSGSHTFTATNTQYSDISTNELAASGNYSTGGATLSGKAVTKAATTYWSASNTAWASATFTAAYAVLYDTSDSNHLIACFDLGGNQSVSSGTFTIQWNASGIIALT